MHVQRGKTTWRDGKGQKSRELVFPLALLLITALTAGIIRHPLSYLEKDYLVIFPVRGQLHVIQLL